MGSGDPCGRPGVGLWLLSLTPIEQNSVSMESESDIFDEGG